MWTADKLGYKGNTSYIRAYQGDELVWEKQSIHPIPQTLLFLSDGSIVLIEDSILQQALIANNYKETLVMAVIGTNVVQIQFNTFTACNSLTTIIVSDAVREIWQFGIAHCNSLVNLTLGHGLTKISDWGLSSNTSLTAITYNGTKTEWNAISKGRNYLMYSPVSVVHCTDGDVAI